MTNIIQGNFVTVADLPPEQILEAAKGKITMAIVVGRTTEGRLYIAGSIADLFVVGGWLDAAKKYVTDSVYEGLAA